MVGVEEIVLAGAVGAIALADSEEAKGPSSKFVGEWQIEKSYGFLTDGSEVVVLVRNKEKTLGDASDNQIDLIPYYSGALIAPDSEYMTLTIFGGASNLANWPNSNPDFSLADELAQNYWDNTGGSGDEGPAGPIGPQNPSPPSRPQLPDTGGASLGSQISNPDDFNIDDLRNAGRYGDTELVHVNQEEVDMLIQQGGSGSINPQTGLREFFQANLSSNIQEQIEAYFDGQESCFDFVTGNSNQLFAWIYSDGGKVLQLDDDDNLGIMGNDPLSARIGLRITQGYTVGMVTSIDGGFFAKKDAGTADVFDSNYLTQTKTGSVARYEMVGGDLLQIDIDGIDGGIGDFIITSKGQQITKSVSVDNDVFLTISSVKYTGDKSMDIDDIDFVDVEPDEDIFDNGDDSEEEEPRTSGSPTGRSPLVLGLGLVALGIVGYIIFFGGASPQTGEMRL
jgi:hypothetical protein